MLTEVYYMKTGSKYEFQLIVCASARIYFPYNFNGLAREVLVVQISEKVPKNEDRYYTEGDNNSILKLFFRNL